MANVENYWWVLIAVGVLVALIVVWTLLRGRSASPPVDHSRREGPLEPVKPVIDVAQPVAFTAPEPAPVPVAATPDSASARPAIAAAVGEPDDLRLIKGVGPKLVALLASLGITRFDQIAAWTEADIAEVDGFLGTFQGRIARDNWVEQAGYLARGDVEGFKARFGAV